MGRMANSLLIVLAIEASLYLLVTSSGGTPLLSFILNMAIWDNGAFVAALVGIIGTIGGGAIIIGSFTNKLDWIFRASIVSATFLGYAMVFSDLWRFIYTYEGTLGSSTPVVAALIIGPLVIFYLLTLIDFISGKD